MITAIIISNYYTIRIIFILFYYCFSTFSKNNIYLFHLLQVKFLWHRTLEGYSKNKYNERDAMPHITN